MVFVCSKYPSFLPRSSALHISHVLQRRSDGKHPTMLKSKLNFGNNELIKETFVFEIFWEILYHSESKTVINVFLSRSAYAFVQTNTNI